MLQWRHRQQVLCIKVYYSKTTGPQNMLGKKKNLDGPRKYE